MSRFNNIAILGLLMIGASASALAQSQVQSDYKKTIDQLGAQGGAAYFNVKEGLTLNCSYGNIYMDITTDAGRVAYAELLAAKVAGKQLSRIDYTQASPGSMCTLSLVEIQQ